MSDYTFTPLPHYSYVNIPLNSLNIRGSVQSFNVVKWGGFNYIPQVFMDYVGTSLSILINSEDITSDHSITVLIVTD